MICADGHRHIKTLRQGEKPWHWTSLNAGVLQPTVRLGFKRWGGPRRWVLSVPLAWIARDGEKWQYGLRWGRRTAYIHRHR